MFTKRIPFYSANRQRPTIKPIGNPFLMSTALKSFGLPLGTAGSFTGIDANNIRGFSHARCFEPKREYTGEEALVTTDLLTVGSPIHGTRCLYQRDYCCRNDFRGCYFRARSFASASFSFRSYS